MPQHTLSVLVENTPDTLTRIVALCSRRGFVVDSLAIGTTETPELSRITAVVRVDDAPALQQVTKQLNKLVNVVKVSELEDDGAVRRELVLVKVRAGADTRAQVTAIAGLFRARTVDVAPDALTIEASGSPDKLDAMLRLLAPFGIKELVQSGTVAIGRGSRSLTERAVREPRPLRLTA
jgi:acetolactate synthase-1/3 small subunit